MEFSQLCLIGKVELERALSVIPVFVGWVVSELDWCAYIVLQAFHLIVGVSLVRRQLRLERLVHLRVIVDGVAFLQEEVGDALHNTCLVLYHHVVRHVAIWDGLSNSWLVRQLPIDHIIDSAK